MWMNSIAMPGASMILINFFLVMDKLIPQEKHAGNK